MEKFSLHFDNKNCKSLPLLSTLRRESHPRPGPERGERHLSQLENICGNKTNKQIADCGIKNTRVILIKYLERC